MQATAQSSTAPIALVLPFRLLALHPAPYPRPALFQFGRRGPGRWLHFGRRRRRGGLGRRLHRPLGLNAHLVGLAGCVQAVPATWWWLLADGGHASPALGLGLVVSACRRLSSAGSAKVMGRWTSTAARIAAALNSTLPLTGNALAIAFLRQAQRRHHTTTPARSAWLDTARRSPSSRTAELPAR